MNEIVDTHVRRDLPFEPQRLQSRTIRDQTEGVAGSRFATKNNVDFDRPGIGHKRGQCSHIGRLAGSHVNGRHGI